MNCHGGSLGVIALLDVLKPLGAVKGFGLFKAFGLFKFRDECNLPIVCLRCCRYKGGGLVWI